MNSANSVACSYASNINACRSGRPRHERLRAISPCASSGFLQVSKQVNQDEQAGRHAEQPGKQIFSHCHSPVAGQAFERCERPRDKLQYPGQDEALISTPVSNGYLLPAFSCFAVLRTLRFRQDTPVYKGKGREFLACNSPDSTCPAGQDARRRRELLYHGVLSIEAPPVADERWHVPCP